MAKTLNFFYRVYTIVFSLPLIIFFLSFLLYFLFKNRKSSNILLLGLNKKMELDKFLKDNREKINHSLYIFWILVLMYFTFK